MEFILASSTKTPRRSREVALPPAVSTSPYEPKQTTFTLHTAISQCPIIDTSLCRAWQAHSDAAYPSPFTQPSGKQRYHKRSCRTERSFILLCNDLALQFCASECQTRQCDLKTFELQIVLLITVQGSSEA